MHFIKKIIQDSFTPNFEERSSKELGQRSSAIQKDDSQSNHSFDEQFDDESVFYTKPNDNVQKISDDNTITPAITPDNFTTSNRATPDYTYYNNNHDDNKNNPLRMPDGQIDPYVFWLKDEKRYLFTEGRLILTGVKRTEPCNGSKRFLDSTSRISAGNPMLNEKSPTYAIPTDFCHTDSSQKKHRIMIYYDINKSFEKRFGYYDSSNCLCEVEYMPEFAFIY
jgi:hypothetical protein